jgi:hypothetical protein
MINSILEYIVKETRKDEKIFDTFKSTLFYFLSDRERASFHLVMTWDVMRPDEQKDIIESLKREKVRLVITEKSRWDNIKDYCDRDFNPLTYQVWDYLGRDFDIVRDFGKYYILIKK